VKGKILVFIGLLLALLLLPSANATDITTCQDLSTAYSVYNLTQDITNSGDVKCMNITAENVILDCQGHTIDGVDNANSYGVQVNRSSSTDTNVTIRNCILKDWDRGVNLKYANNNTLTNNTANNNVNQGIYLLDSDNNTIYNNTADNNPQSIRLSYSGNNTVYNNIVDTTGYSCYYIVSSRSTNNTLYNNTATRCGRGFYIESNSNNTLYSNIARNCTWGFLIGGSHNNTIYNNTMDNNTRGLYINLASDNNIFNNTVKNSTDYGVYIDNAGSNNIYNNLFNNTNNVYFTGTINEEYWNTTDQTGARIGGLPGSQPNYIGGNYYSNSTGNDFSDTCVDSDTDGYCDNALNMTNWVTCTPGTDCGNNVDYLAYSDEYIEKWHNTSTSFVPSVIESEKRSFSILVELSDGYDNVSDAELIWNSTSFGYDSKTTSGNISTFTRDMVIPFLGDNLYNYTDISFYWSYTLDSEDPNSTTAQTQRVYRMYLTNCTFLSSTMAFNFTTRDANTFNDKHANFTATFEIFINSSMGRSYPFNYSEQSEHEICIFPINASYLTNATIIYWSNDYKHRNYYFYHANISIYIC